MKQSLNFSSSQLLFRSVSFLASVLQLLKFAASVSQLLSNAASVSQFRSFFVSHGVLSALEQDPRFSLSENNQN
jgi:hypothetical protein